MAGERFYSGINLQNRGLAEQMRVLQRTDTVASSGTPTIDTDVVDYFSITALAVAITSMTTNLSGTANDADNLVIAITDNGTARAIAWGADFEDSAVLLPLTTILGERLDVHLRWNSVTSKWRCIDVTNADGDVTLNTAQTLTNKRITKRETTEASSATPTINTDVSDYHSVTALALAITSFTANLTGTPLAGDKLVIEITDTGADKAIAFGASFEDGDIKLPEQTIGGITLITEFSWNDETNAWAAMARTGSQKSGTIGDGATQDPIFTHNLGTKLFTYEAYLTLTPFDKVGIVLERTTSKTATFIVEGTVLASAELTVVFKAL